jgi:FKBP-type peptidyl-prolyl cis-trans isomerase SlyD
MLKEASMGIQVVSFNCILKSRTGQLISSTFNNEVLAANQAEGGMLSGLVSALQNLVKGEKRLINLTAAEAYGFYDPSKVILFPRNKLPKHLKTGQKIQIVGKSGAIREYKLIELHTNMASLDGNHPLAGQDLIFEIEVLSAREASESEIAESANTVVEQVLH